MKKTFLLFALILASCGSSGTSTDTEIETNSGISASVGTPDAATDINSAGLVSNNPIALTQTFGTNGNLYKPAGDDHGGSPGNLVVLLSSEFKDQFDSCEIKLRNGEVAQLICINDQPWTQIPYSCFTNGNRQTWRANFGCSSVGEVRVVCREEKQEVTFTVPEAKRNQVCTRFG